MARQLRPGQLRTGSYYDITASFAYTSSVSLSGSTGPVSAGSFIASGHVTGSVSTGPSAFLLTSASYNLLEITKTGVMILATQSVDPPTGSVAPNGGIYFTSSSLFVGLD
jgi:hypothetical protein